MPVQTDRPTRDPSRARRTVLTLAAAAAVVLLPTACDYAVADTGGSGGGYGLPSGHSGHGGAPTVSDVETVPAGATETLVPTSSPAETSTEETAPTETGPTETSPTETSATETSPTETSATETSPTETSTTETGTEETTTETTTSSAPPTVTPPAPLDILGVDCTGSDLEPHDGFQKSPRCVAIAFGEVAAEALSPSLLITEAPQSVAPGEDFTLTVSTRNLVRDRFLGAAAGGYYRESSFLNAAGVQRGHFHTACRLLSSTGEAPDAALVPEFFLATQDNGGGSSEPDQVVVPVDGAKILGTGTLQCAVWAGDGSHRVPMMTRANQTPAFDIVRIPVG
jgi:hypothetical protein